MRMLIILITCLFFAGCGEKLTTEPDVNIKPVVIEIGAFNTVYDSSLIESFKLTLDSAYTKDSIMYRKPFVWWEMFNKKCFDTVLVQISKNDTDYYYNDNRILFEGRFYTQWLNNTHKITPADEKVYFKCNYKNKVIFKTGFKLK